MIQFHLDSQDHLEIDIHEFNIYDRSVIRLVTGLYFLCISV